MECVIIISVIIFFILAGFGTIGGSGINLRSPGAGPP